MAKKAKFFLFVLGCQMNENDAERLRYLLTKIGLEEVESDKDADLIIVLLCSVRQAPVDRIWGKLRVWSKKKSFLLLSGCITRSDKAKFSSKFDLIFPILKPEKLLNFIFSQQLIDKPAFERGKQLAKKGFFNIKAQRRSNRAYIPIGTGCNNFCTYCVVPYTRGREKYRPFGEIEKEVVRVLREGAKRIVFIAQNVNSYRLDKKARIFLQKHYGQKPDFVLLLTYFNDLEGDFRIEFLTSHPKDMSEELIEAIGKLDKVVKWIHLPVQSGDNEILKKMNRGYTRERYLELVKKIRQKIPKVILTTDIIVGFPQETEKQFQNTVDLVKKCRFDQAFIAKFSPRPNTLAADLDDNVPLKEKKRRFEILDNLINKTGQGLDNPWKVAEGGRKKN